MAYHGRPGAGAGRWCRRPDAHLRDSRGAHRWRDTRAGKKHKVLAPVTQDHVKTDANLCRWNTFSDSTSLNKDLIWVGYFLPWHLVTAQVCSITSVVPKIRVVLY
jgi:hypothetical protein